MILLLLQSWSTIQEENASYSLILGLFYPETGYCSKQGTPNFQNFLFMKPNAITHSSDFFILKNNIRRGAISASYVVIFQLK